MAVTNATIAKWARKEIDKYRDSIADLELKMIAQPHMSTHYARMMTAAYAAVAVLDELLEMIEGKPSE